VLVELTGHPLDRLNGMVREAINAVENENKRELEDLLSALHDIRWKAGDRRRRRKLVANTSHRLFKMYTSIY
jgi:hypothetical protein